MKHLFFLVIFISCSLPCFAADQSQNLNPTQIKHIILYSKVWGFLKYYHPAVADGNIDWDAAFIDTYPSIKNASTEADFNKALLALFQKAEYARKDSLHPVASLDADQKEMQIADFTWITSGNGLGDNVKQVLNKLLKEFQPQYSHYIYGASKVGNPVLDNDNAFYSNKDLSEPLRELALARYWNIINYFYPYKEGIGRPWDAILSEFTPRLSNASDMETYNFTIVELCNSIHDSHSTTYSEIIGENSKYSLPIELAYIEGKTIVKGPATFYAHSDSLINALGLHSGDVVTEIDGKDVAGLRKKLMDFVPHSNDAAAQRNISNRLFLWKTNAPVTLTIDDGKSKRKISAVPMISVADTMKGKKSHSSWKILDSNIGYVDLGTLDKSEIDKAMADLQNTRSIIFDVRNYPNFILYQLTGRLAAPHPFYYSDKPNISHPGYLINELNPGPVGKNQTYNGKIALLVNEQTQSRAEFTVLALQSIPGSKTFGSQTAGADGTTSTVFLPGGIKTVFTGIGIFYPDGSPAQHVGVKIDYQVRPTIKGIREGHDEVLERAIKYINSGS